MFIKYRMANRLKALNAVLSVGTANHSTDNESNAPSGDLNATITKKRKRGEAEYADTSDHGTHKKRRRFIAAVNPFDDLDRSVARRDRRKDTLRKNDASTFVVPPASSLSNQNHPNTGTHQTAPTTTTGTGTPNVDGDTWVPYSVSEDTEVYFKYGIDPNHHASLNRRCFGCDNQCESVPIRDSNVKILFEKINQSASNCGSALKRAEMIRGYYVELIKKPKEEFRRLLKSQNRTTGLMSEYDSRFSDSTTHDFEDRCSLSDYAPGSSLSECESELSEIGIGKYQRESRRQILRKKVIREEKKEEQSDDDWTVLDIYVHLTKHCKNHAHQVQVRLDALWKTLSLMERTLFKQHTSKKDVQGNSVVVPDPTEIKNYTAIYDRWMTTFKLIMSMQGNKSNGIQRGLGGGGSTEAVVGEMNVNVSNSMGSLGLSGRILFGKKKKESSTRV